MNPADQFKTACEAAGLVPGEIIPDGAIHRCGTVGKERGQDGAYLFHADPPASGWYQNHRTGQAENWTDGNSDALTPAEREALAHRIETDKQARQEETAKRQAEARAKAKEIWGAAEPCPAKHPYLVRKGIQPHGARKGRDGQIILAVLDEKGAVMSLQFIGVDGQKLFLPGGQIRGGFFVIGKDKAGRLCICEGFATGASIHEATGATVLVAFDCGNLAAVAAMARRLYLKREIIVCADDDHKTEGNPGITKATLAAKEAKALLAIPVFTDPEGKTDFNDLYQAEGLERVKACLDAARKPGGAVTTGFFPFKAKATGVFYLEEMKEGGIDEQWLCSPLEVAARTCNEDGQDHGRLLIVKDARGNRHQWAMPMTLTAGSGDEYRAHLKYLGLELAPGQKGKQRLELYLNLARAEKWVRCVSRVGWHDRRFVLPDAVYGPEAGEGVIMQGGPGDHAFRVAGTLAQWQEHIGRYCPGNSRLVFAVSAAFAGPLLNLTNAESGGIHFDGGSSIGKTTAARVAGSVCGGGGVRGYLFQWRATANGLESIAAAHCDCPLVLDEMGQADAKQAGEVAYMLANGTGKARAQRNGTGRKPAEWRILFLSTGEVTLADKVREDGKGRAMAGQAVRVVDIAADAGAGLGLFENLHGFENGSAFSRHLSEASSRYYGSPLRAFLEKLTADYDEAAVAAPAFIKKFTEEFCPAGADGQVRRVAGRFGLIAAAGELATVAGVTQWGQGEARAAAVRCFNDWLARRGGIGAAEVKTGLEQVRAFFQAHGSSRFETWGDNADAARIINRAGFRRPNNAGEWEYYVPVQVFREEIAKGQNAKRLVKELVGQELIIPGRDGLPSSLHKITGQTAARYYHFSPGVVGGEE